MGDLSASAGKQSGVFNLLIAGCKNGPVQKPVLSRALPVKVSVPGQSIKVFESEISSSLQKNTNEVWLFRLKGKSSAQISGVMVEPSINVFVKDPAGKTLKYPCRWLPRYLPNQSKPVVFDYCFPMMPSLLKERIVSVQVSLARTDTKSVAGNDLEIDDFCLEIVPIAGNPISNQSSYY